MFQGRLISIALVLMLSLTHANHSLANDYYLDAEKLSLEPDDPRAGTSVEIKCETRNESSRSNPDGGKGTFDVEIGFLNPANRTESEWVGNNVAYRVNGTRTFTMDAEFTRAGTYTVFCKTYNIRGRENGGRGSDRFDNLQKLVTIKSNSPPGEADSLSPSDRSRGVSLTPQLRWTAVSDADGDAVTHKLYFGRDSSPDNGEFIGEFSNSNSRTRYSPGELRPATTYYWQVVTTDGFDETESDVWRFTTESENRPPGEADYFSPEDGATGVSRTTELRWTAVTDQDGDTVTHKLFFGRDSSPDGGEYIGDFTNSNSRTRYRPEQLRPDTTYYWQVITTDGKDETSSDIWRFTTESEDTNTPPGKANLITPGDRATGVNRSPELRWTAVSDPDGDTVTHRLYFGQDPSPDDDEFVGDFGNSNSLTRYSPSRLRANTTYYWQVITTDGTDETPGDVWRFTTEQEDDNHPPGKANVISPSDRASNVSITPQLRWTAVSDQDGDTVTHKLFFGRDSSPDSGEYIGDFTNSNSQTRYNPPQLLPGTTYYWQVITTDGTDETPGDIWRFTTESAGENNPPGQAQYISPEDRATGISRTPELRWTAVSDLDGDTVTHRLYFGRDSTPDSGEFVAEYANSNSQTRFRPGRLLPETTYFWQVVTTDGEDNTESDIWRFTTGSDEEGNTAPGKASHFSPGNGTTGVSLNPQLSWSAVSDADGDSVVHKLYLGPQANLSNDNLVGEFRNNNSETRFTPTDSLAANTTYFWRVVTSDGTDETASDVWRFTTTDAANDAGPVVHSRLQVIPASDQGVPVDIVDADLAAVSDGLSHIDTQTDVIVIVHGWRPCAATECGNLDEMTQVRPGILNVANELRQSRDANVLVWNWAFEAEGRGPDGLSLPIVPRWKVDAQARKLSKALRVLFDEAGFDSSTSIHLVGHSLGAGLVVKAVNYPGEDGLGRRYFNRVSRVTTVDPPEALITTVRFAKLWLSDDINALLTESSGRILVDNYIALGLHSFGREYEGAVNVYVRDFNHGGVFTAWFEATARVTEPGDPRSRVGFNFNREQLARYNTTRLMTGHDEDAWNLYPAWDVVLIDTDRNFFESTLDAAVPFVKTGQDTRPRTGFRLEDRTAAQVILDVPEGEAFLTFDVHSDGLESDDQLSVGTAFTILLEEHGSTLGLANPAERQIDLAQWRGREVAVNFRLQAEGQGAVVIRNLYLLSGSDDIDDDGISNEDDAFPLVSEWQADTDGDGLANLLDNDDDGDGQPDFFEEYWLKDPVDPASRLADFDNMFVARQFLQTSTSGFNQTELNVVNGTAESIEMWGALLNHTGEVIGPMRQLRSIGPRARRIYDSHDIEQLFGAPTWNGPAMLELYATGDFELISKLRSPSNLVTNVNCSSDQFLGYITSPDATRPSYVRFINAGDRVLEHIHATLFDHEGSPIGNAQSILVPRLNPRQAIWLNSEDIAERVGAKWSDVAMLQVAPIADLRLLNLVFTEDTFFNYSCIDTSPDANAYLHTANTHLNFSETHILNLADEPQHFSARLFDQEGNKLAGRRLLSDEPTPAKGRLILGTEDIEAVFEGLSWRGPALLDISGRAKYGVLTNLVSPSGLASNTNCVRQKVVHDVEGSDSSALPFIRLVNIGERTIFNIVGSLYDQHGQPLGQTGRLLTARLGANSAIWLTLDQLQSTFNTRWEGSASLEVESSDNENLRLLLLKQIDGETYFNFSCYESAVETR